MKTCSECGKEKDDSLFVKNKNQCKDCKKEYQKRYRLNNGVRLTENKKKYYIDNQEHAKQKSKQYRKNPKNKNKISVIQNKYRRNRYKNEPQYKLRTIIRAAIYKSFRKSGLSKNDESCLLYLPYSIQELKEHIEKQFESWMTWNNQGTYDKNIWNDNDPNTWKWQIDHIIPASTFNYNSMEDKEFKRCWALNNLRPYSAKQNLLDSDRNLKSNHA